MFTMVAFNARKAFSGVAAAVVVMSGIAMLDQGHLIGAPRGTIEVGEPVLLVDGQPVASDQMVAMLPEITVSATRLTDEAAPSQPAMLSEVVVTAKRLPTMVAGSGAVSAALSTASALLK